MSRLKVSLLTGRTIYQGVSKESGKLSEGYQRNVAICEIDPDDINLLGIKENSSVKVATGFGSVVLRAVKSSKAPHPGVIFIPYSVFANVLTGTRTHSTGMPSFKGIPAEVEPVKGERITGIRDLLREFYGK